uniref:Carboxypeptidase n=1 Tax=Ditylenchus dipsaci TaxID=166011 RepID=A0A915CR34_9BILA
MNPDHWDREIFIPSFTPSQGTTLDILTLLLVISFTIGLLSLNPTQQMTTNFVVCPGCSSLEGLLQELGPYFINDDGATLRPNPNAWNKFANVLFLESSAGVGFSYSVDGNVTTNDDQTAQENYIAIQQFLKKFPAFTSNPVFITGESYAGIYVPTLVSLILDGQDNHHINLQGMAIGNGVANNELDVTTKLEFFYYHGIIDEADWQLFLAKCCDGNVGKCKISDFEQPKCDLVNGFLEDQPDYNPYDIYRKCESSTEKTAARSAKYRSRNLTSKMSWGSSSSNGVTCFNDTAITTYLNTEAVKKALNIPNEVGKWIMCNDDIFERYERQYPDTSVFIKKAIDANIRVLLYYGDTDTVCNFLMGQRFSQNLGYKVVEKKKAWKVDGQVAGFKTSYEKDFTFITVLGSGHMAPEWRAVQTKFAIENFVQNKPI